MEQILLLHGAIGAKDYLKPLADALSSKYEILSLDFSGHGGKAFVKEPFSIPLFADEVLSFLNENDIDSIHVLGYSMGGYVGMCLAKHHPLRVKKIVTLATKFYWDEEVAAKEVKMLDTEKIEQKLPTFARALQQRHAPNNWKEVLLKTRDMLLALGKQNALEINDYSSIDNACLLLIGDRDKMITLDETVAVYKQLPNAQMSMLPNTPHPIEQVNLEALVYIIEQFLRN